MGITRATLVNQINVKFTLPQLYPDVTFEFPLRLQLAREARQAQSDMAGLNKEERAARSQEQNVSQLAQLLTAEPSGFEDFPQDERPLSTRAREYFSGEGLNEEDEESLRLIVNSALSIYWGGLLPKTDYL